MSDMVMSEYKTSRLAIEGDRLLEEVAKQKRSWWLKMLKWTNGQ